jgi:hypothetical protein
MADNLPINFPLPNESAIASYDYTDIADGTGVIQYYGMRVITNAAETFILITSPLLAPGAVASKTRLLSGSTADFDLTPYTTPRVLKGTAYINCQNYSANTNYITGVITHVRGVTETDISSTVTSQSCTGASEEAFLIPLPLTETLFKIGDFLRVTISVAGLGGGIAIDPQMINGDQPLKIFIPYKITL